EARALRGAAGDRGEETARAQVPDVHAVEARRGGQPARWVDVERFPRPPASGHCGADAAPGHAPEADRVPGAKGAERPPVGRELERELDAVRAHDRLAAQAAQPESPVETPRREDVPPRMEGEEDPVEV